MMGKFWTFWCGFFFAFDVVSGVRHVLQGDPGGAVFFFVLAIVMAACGVFNVRLARKAKLREEESRREAEALHFYLKHIKP